jgi:hypothetical protein
MKASDRCREEIDCLAGYFCEGGVYCAELRKMVPDDYACRKFSPETRFRLPQMTGEVITQYTKE